MMSDLERVPALLNRRQLLVGGAALVASASMASAASGITPASDNDVLFATARRELDRAGARIWLRDVVGLADFSRPSSMPRFFLLDMVSGVVKPFYVTHGRGSDPEHDGWLKNFSNEDSSFATSRGAFLTRPFYEGKHGLSMRLVGLDRDNSNADPRAIVIHAAEYANPDLIVTQGKLGRSEGCFVLPPVNLMEVLGRLGPGRMLFADRMTPWLVPPAPTSPLPAPPAISVTPAP
jgi:hypothetical protein